MYVRILNPSEPLPTETWWPSKGHENSDEKIKALVDALKSGEAKKFIEETYEGAVVPLHIIPSGNHLRGMEMANESY